MVWLHQLRPSAPTLPMWFGFQLFCPWVAFGILSWSALPFLSQKNKQNIKTKQNKSRHLGSSSAVPLCQVAVAMELTEIMSLSLPAASSGLDFTASNFGSNFSSSLSLPGKCDTFLFKSVSRESLLLCGRPPARHRGNLSVKLEEIDWDFSRFQTFKMEASFEKQMS